MMIVSIVLLFNFLGESTRIRWRLLNTAPHKARVLAFVVFCWLDCDYDVIPRTQVRHACGYCKIGLF